MIMASKEREYIERQRQMYRSPLELQKDIDARYGADAEQKMDFKEVHEVFNEAMGWAMSHDIAMRDYWAEQCGYAFQWDENDPKPIIKKVVASLKVMAKHLAHGLELGLSDMEQQVIDTLWGWVPHDYQNNYVICAREVSEVIVRLLPPESEERSEDGYIAYYNQVMAEVKMLAAKYDVDFDMSDYNLSAGYFYDWMSDEYGMIFDDAWDREY